MPLSRLCPCPDAVFGSNQGPCRLVISMEKKTGKGTVEVMMHIFAAAEWGPAGGQKEKENNLQ